MTLMTALPAVFVSHGSSMLALDGGRTGEAWRALAAAMPAPRAVMMISAHWETTHAGIAEGALAMDVYTFEFARRTGKTAIRHCVAAAHAASAPSPD
jgi:aromatic ring-opening dioxygenase catalytic subunit (LigB family)